MLRPCLVRRVLPACALFALLLAGFGCDQKETSCPAVCQGRIEGYVMGGDGPIRADMQAYSSIPGGPEIDVDAETDSTGYYELPVPSGRFVVSAYAREYGTRLLYSARGITLDRHQADTVAVQEGPVRIDFIGGGFTLDLSTPQVVEDEYIECRVESFSDATCVDSHPFLAGNGHVVLRFPLLPPGEYAVRVRLSEGDFWLPRGDRSSVDTIGVVARHTTTYAARLPSPGYILGRVQGSWQAMGFRPPPIVRAFRTEEEMVTQAWADTTGAFALKLFAPGPVRLRVDGTGPGLWVGGGDFARATIFDVDSAEMITGVSIVESGILCRLEGPPNDELELCGVSLWDGEGRPILQNQLFSGDPFAICNLHPGSYRLKVEPYSSSQHWFPRFYDGADSFSAATPIVIATEGELVSVTLHLIVSGSISGRVLRSDGTGADRASVFVAPAADPSQLALAARTAGSWDPGAFTIPRLHTGDYRVGARIGSAPATWYPGTADWDSAGVIHIVEGSEVSGIEWRLRE